MHRFNSTGFDFQGLYKETTEHYNLMKELLNKYKENEIMDFDDHFIDPNCDWRNNFIDLFLK